MVLNEILQSFAKNYQDQSQDQSVVKLKDVRKTRLTLAQINSLRQMNDVRRYEQEKSMADIQRQYMPPAQ